MSKSKVVREVCHVWAGEVAQSLREAVGDRPHHHANQFESKHQFITSPELLAVNVTVKVTRNGAYKITYTSGQERRWTTNEARRHWTYSKSIPSGSTTKTIQRLIELGLDRAVDEVIREGRANTLYHNFKTQLDGPRGAEFVQLLDKEIWKGQTIDYEVMTWAQIQQWEAWLEKYYKGELAQETPAIENEAQKFDAENPDKPTIPVEPIGPPAQPVEILRRGDSGMEVTPAYFAMNPVHHNEVAQREPDEYDQKRMAESVAQAIWDNHDSPDVALENGLMVARGRVSVGQTWDWRKVQNQIKNVISAKRYSKYRDDRVLLIDRENTVGQVCDVMRRAQNNESDLFAYPLVHLAHEVESDLDNVRYYCGVQSGVFMGVKQFMAVGPPPFSRICPQCLNAVALAVESGLEELEEQEAQDEQQYES